MQSRTAFVPPRVRTSAAQIGRIVRSLLMAAAPLFASQSLQLAPATRSTGFIPANTPSWSNLGDLRIEGHVFNYVAQAGTTVGIFELDSDMCIKILGDNELVF